MRPPLLRSWSTRRSTFGWLVPLFSKAVPGAPVPSVTFRPEPTGHVLVEGIEVPTDGEVTAAALTVEPESCSPQPTTPIRLVGPLKRST